MNSQKKCWKKYIELCNRRSYLFQPSELIKIELNSQIVDDYCEQNKIEIGVIYTSNYHMLIVDLIIDSTGNYYAYERLVPFVEDQAVVIACKVDGKYVLLKQYRHALRDFQFGFPRGFGELGLSGLQNVEKELEEELNAKALTIRYLGEVSGDSGIKGGVANVYYANLESISCNLNHEGIIDILLLSDDEIENMVKDNQITDGFTIAALYLAKLNGV